MNNNIMVTVAIKNNIAPLVKYCAILLVFTLPYQVLAKPKNNKHNLANENIWQQERKQINGFVTQAKQLRQQIKTTIASIQRDNNIAFTAQQLHSYNQCAQNIYHNGQDILNTQEDRLHKKNQSLDRYKAGGSDAEKKRVERIKKSLSIIQQITSEINSAINNASTNNPILQKQFLELDNNNSTRNHSAIVGVVHNNVSQITSNSDFLADAGFDENFGEGLFDEPAALVNYVVYDPVAPTDSPTRNLLADAGFDENFGNNLFDETINTTHLMNLLNDSNMSATDITLIVQTTSPINNLFNNYTTKSPTVTNIAHNIANSNIEHRLYYSLLPTMAVAAADESHINISRMDVWGSLSYGTNSYIGRNKYSGKTYGVTIGADTVLDTSVIGIAYHYVRSDFKYKNNSDQIFTKGYLISLYAQKDLSNKIVLQAVGTIGLNNVYIKSAAQGQIRSGTIKNKPSYSGIVALAYKGKIGKLFITPNIGIKYGFDNSNSYALNLVDQSIDVASACNTNTAIIIGLTTQLPIQINDTTVMTPGLHAAVENSLHNKLSKLYIYNSKGIRSSIPLEKMVQYSYKLGGDLSITKGRTKIRAVYDYFKTNKKYSSHQGVIKLKVAL